MGRVSRSWRNVQRRHFELVYPHRNFSADVWIRRVIGRIYRMTQSLWKFRCDYVHGVENVLTSKRDKKALQKEIRKQYQLGTAGVRAAERELFTQDMTSVLQSSVRDQKYWVRTIRLSRAYMAESEKNMFIGMRNVMLQWARPPD